MAIIHRGLLRKLKHYMIHVPGDVYASDCYGYNKKDTVATYKIKWCLKRMPNGYAIWEV